MRLYLVIKQSKGIVVFKRVRSGSDALGEAGLFLNLSQSSGNLNFRRRGMESFGAGSGRSLRLLT